MNSVRPLRVVTRRPFEVRKSVANGRTELRRRMYNVHSTSRDGNVPSVRYQCDQRYGDAGCRRRHCLGAVIVRMVFFFFFERRITVTFPLGLSRRQQQATEVTTTSTDGRHLHRATTDHLHRDRTTFGRVLCVNIVVTLGARPCVCVCVCPFAIAFVWYTRYCCTARVSKCACADGPTDSLSRRRRRRQFRCRARTSTGACEFLSVVCWDFFFSLFISDDNAIRLNGKRKQRCPLRFHMPSVFENRQTCRAHLRRTRQEIQFGTKDQRLFANKGRRFFFQFFFLYYVLVSPVRSSRTHLRRVFKVQNYKR